MKKAFLLYNDRYEMIKELSNDDKASLLDSLFLYQIGQEVNPTYGAKIILEFMKKKFSEDKEKRNNRGKNSAENGKSGGRPKSKTHKPRKPVQVTTAPVKTHHNPSDTVNVNVLSKDNSTVQEIKNFIYDTYGDEEVKESIPKFKLLMKFIENGYDKIEKSKKGMDGFFEKLEEKSAVFKLSPPGQTNRDELLKRTVKMYDWAKDKGHTIENHISQLNTFLEDKQK